MFLFLALTALSRSSSEAAPSFKSTPTFHSGYKISAATTKHNNNGSIDFVVKASSVHKVYQHIVKPSVTVTVRDPQDHEATFVSKVVWQGRDVSGNDVWGVHLDPQMQMPVGTYTATFTVTDANGLKEVTNEHFTWGVLALNLNKSVYKPGDSVHFSMAVLDSQGEMACNAKLNLQITGPANATLSTHAKSIRVNPACELKAKTTQPDFEAQWKIPQGAVGDYTLTLSATTRAGTYTITELMGVQALPVMTITRDGPTRLFPPATYEMKLGAVPFSDFTGTISEPIPNGFAISDQSAIIDDQTRHVVGTVTTDPAIFQPGEVNHGAKYLTWQVSLQANHHYSFDYRFIAPSISPELWLLGPLQMQNNYHQVIYTEPRAWQLAADATTTWNMYASTVTADSVPAVTNDANASTGDPDTTAQANKLVFGATTGTYLFKPGVTSTANNAPLTPGTDHFGYWTTNPYVGSTTAAAWTFVTRTTSSVTTATCRPRVILYTNTSRTTTGMTQLFDTGDMTTNNLCSATTANRSLSQTFTPAAKNFTTTAPSGSAKYVFVEFWVDVTTGAGAGANLTLNVNGATAGVTVATDSAASLSAGANITGTLYSDDGITPWGITPVVRARKNGAFCTTCGNTVVSNVYTSAVSTPASNDVITVEVISGTNKANLITKYTPANTAADGKNMITEDLYKNDVIVRGSAAGSVSNADLAQYDESGGGTPDSSMMFTVTAGAYVGDAGSKVYVWTGQTYAPAGNVTTPVINIQGTYSGGSETLTVTNSGTGTSRPFLVNGGTFTPSTDTVKFTGTGSTEIDAGHDASVANTTTYANLTLQPASGTPTYTLGTNASGRILVNTLATLGDGSVTVTVSNTTYNTTFSPAKMTINTNATYTGGTENLTLTGGGTGTSRPLFVNGGTYSGGSNTTFFNGPGTSDIDAGANTTYNALWISGLNSNPTYRLGNAASQTLRINGNLAVGFSFFSTTSVVDWTTWDPAITLKGGIGIQSGSSWMKSDTATLTWSAIGAQTWADANLTPVDMGKISITGGTSTPSVQLASSVSAQSINLAASNTLDLNTSSYTLTLTGSGTGSSRPFIVNASATFTSGTSTVAFTGTSATEMQATTYSSLQIAPSSGSATYTLGTATSQSVTLNGDLTISASATFDWDTYDPSLLLKGNLTLANGGLWTKSGSATLTWTVSGTKAWSDSNRAGFFATPQDLGTVLITGGSLTPTVQVTSFGAGATSLTVDTSQTLDIQGKTFVITGSNTTSRPFITTGTFLATASSVTSYQGTGTTDVEGSSNGGGISYGQLNLGSTSGGTYRLGSASSQAITIAGNLNVGNAFGQSATTDLTTYDPAITLKGSFDVESGSSWAKSDLPATFTWSATGAQTWTDNTSSKQDLGIISFTGGTATPSVQLATSVSATTISIATSNKLDLNTLGNTLTLTGSGTPLANSGTLTLATSGSGSTIAYNGTSATNIASTSSFSAGSYYNLKLAPSGAGSPVYTLPATLGTVAGNLTMGDSTNAVTVTAGTNNTALTLNGNLIVNASASYTPAASGVFTWGATDATNNTWTDNNTTKQDMGIISFFGGSGAQTVVASTSVTATKITLAAANGFDISNKTLTLTGSGTAGSRPLNLTGTMTTTGSTVKFTGTSLTEIQSTTYSTLSLMPAGTVTYKLGTAASQTLTVNSALNIGNGSNALTVDDTTYAPVLVVTGQTLIDTGAIFQPATFSTGTLQIKGTYSGGSETATLKGHGSGTSRALYINGGTFTPNSDTIVFTFNGSNDLEATTYNNVSFVTPLTTQNETMIGATIINGNLTMGGNLDAGSGQNYPLTVGGSWIGSGGTFTPRLGTVTLNSSTTAVVIAPVTFYNLTITNPTAKEVDFSQIGTNIVNVTNTFTVTGHAGNLIKLYSNSAGSKWHFHPTGTAAVDYADVKDGGCESGSITINATHTTNSGNNDSCWVFNQAPNAPTSLLQYQSNGTTVIPPGGWTNVATVVMKGTVSDPDGADTDQLCVEAELISVSFTNTENGCGSLVGTGSTASFTLSSISDGTYHWQARTKDAQGLYSSWVSCNSTGSCGNNGDTPPAGIDFGVDTAPPTVGVVCDQANASFNTAEVSFNNGTLSTLYAKWDGTNGCTAFTDSTSGIASYQYSAGTTPGGTNVVSLTSNGTGTTVSASASLQTSQSYYVNVKATDNAGNVSSVVSSPGILVTPTLNFSLSTGSVNLGTLDGTNGFAPSPSTVGITAGTNANAGYTIYVRAFNNLIRTGGSQTIGMFDGAAPSSSAVWGGSNTGLGFNSNDCKIGPSGIDRWGTGGSCTTGTPTKYAPFTTTAFDTSVIDQIVADHNPTAEGAVSGTPLSDSWTMNMKVVSPTYQAPGTYTTTLDYLMLPSY